MGIDAAVHEVRHDGLTGLANRDYVLKTLEGRIEHGTTMAIFFVDLDGFKEINDTLGHRAGDATLVSIADRLLKRVRHGSLAGRMGGDEFIVLVPVTSFDNMMSLHEFGVELVSAIEAPMHIEGRQITVGASIGLAVHTIGLDADQLISRADGAMYTAKRSGGGLHIANAPETVPIEHERSAS